MADPSTPALRRELGKWDLTAIGINQVIGSGIFLLPAAVAANLGSSAWIVVILVGGLSMLIGLNFAEAASRFEGTGGAYLYTRAAFGRFVSFEVGWMLWATRVTSWASIANGLADALGFYWPELRVGAPRVVLIVVLVSAILALILAGIRQSAIVVNAFTIAKLTPLVLFIALGLPHVSVEALRPDMAALTWTQISTAALLLIFAFGGFEVIPVPAGETRDPTRAVPFAMITVLLIVAVVMTLVHIVAIGTLPTLAASRTPLADSAAVFLGAAGALLMTAGAAISMTGNNIGQALSGSRNLFALAEQSDLPRAVAHVHPRFRTPDVAIVATCLVTLVLALSGSFAALALLSAITRLLVYAGTCASVLALRRQGRAPFTIPFGPVIPVVALVLSVAILYGASRPQLQMGASALAIGAALYIVARVTRRGE